MEYYELPREAVISLITNVATIMAFGSFLGIVLGTFFYNALKDIFKFLAGIINLKQEKSPPMTQETEPGSD